MAKRNGAPSEGLVEFCFELGLSVDRTAEVAGIAKTDAWHAWSVFSGQPVLDDPLPEQIKESVAHIQSGWTEDMRVLAEIGAEHRPSSAVCEHRLQKRRDGFQARKAKRNAKEQQCHSGSIDAKAKASPFPVMTQQMTLSFLSTVCEATA